MRTHTRSTPAGGKPSGTLLRLLAALLALLMMAALSACSDSGELTEPTSVEADSSTAGAEEADSAETAEDAEAEDTEGAEETAAEEEAVSAAVTLESQEIYSQDGVTITTGEISDGLIGPEIAVTVVNDSEQNVMISSDLLSVNGFMCSTSGLYVQVAAGKSANAELTLYSYELEQAGIETVMDVAFTLSLYDSDSYEEIAATDLITLSTSASGTEEQAVDESGDVVYEDNDIKIICRGLSDDTLWDGEVVFLLENDSSQTVYVSAENVSVNGFMEDVSLWVGLRSGTKAVDGMTLLDLEDLALESLDEVESIEFTLRISDAETWEDIDSTEPITLTFGA